MSIYRLCLLSLVTLISTTLLLNYQRGLTLHFKHAGSYNRLLSSSGNILRLGDQNPALHSNHRRPLSKSNTKDEHFVQRKKYLPQNQGYQPVVVAQKQDMSVQRVHMKGGQVKQLPRRVIPRGVQPTDGPDGGEQEVNDHDQQEDIPNSEFVKKPDPFNPKQFIFVRKGGTKLKQEEDKMYGQNLADDQKPMNYVRKGNEVINPRMYKIPKYVDRHRYEYIHKPKLSCAADIVLVLCTPTAVGDSTSRQRLRHQRKFFVNHYNATLVFFLGVSPDLDDGLQSRVDKEAIVHNDIVQENYLDTYKNLSIKSVSITRWVSEFCSTAKFVIKSDPDVLIRPTVLLGAMRRKSLEYPVFVIGQIMKYRPNRNPKSKWYVSFDEYREMRYPKFALGPTYGFTVQAAALLYQASVEIPFFFLEDVFVTGMCRRHKDIPLIRDADFTFFHR